MVPGQANKPQLNGGGAVQQSVECQQAPCVAGLSAVFQGRSGSGQSEQAEVDPDVAGVPLRKASQLARPKVTVRDPGAKSPNDCCQDSTGQ